MKSSAAAQIRQARSMPLWMASRSLLGRQAAEFFLRWKKTAEGLQEDDVHDLRVASRRLREGLALFSPCLPTKRTGKVIKQVKAVTNLLGNLRNTDEAVLFFSALSGEGRGEGRGQGEGKGQAPFNEVKGASPPAAGASPPAAEIERLLAALRGEREQAHKRLKKELKHLPPGPLRRALYASRNRQNVFSNNGICQFISISSFADQALKERAQLLVELLPSASNEIDSEGQHRLRIAIKKMRYRLEILAPLMNKNGYDELHAALKGYQDVLGKLHDIDVFRDLVLERLPEGAGRDGLLGSMAEKRSAIYARFLEMLKSFPLESVGEKASGALSR
jgi:CHAD domain-containing protein